MVVGGGGWVQWREVAGWGAESKVERAGAGRRRQVEGRVRPFDDDGSNGAEVLQRFLRWRLRNGVWSWSWGHRRATGHASSTGLQLAVADWPVRESSLMVGLRARRASVTTFRVVHSAASLTSKQASPWAGMHVPDGHLLRPDRLQYSVLGRDRTAALAVCASDIFLSFSVLVHALLASLWFEDSLLSREEPPTHSAHCSPQDHWSRPLKKHSVP